MLAVAVCRLNSVVTAGAALAPPAIGLLAATPWILAAKGHVDEMTLLGLAAVLAGCLPLVLEIAAAFRNRADAALPGGAAYRWLGRRTPVIAAAAVGAAALLAVPGL
ncbi:MAG: hypothetical protein V3T72_06445, partial [Thermoanaerobaculia bacterium]